MEYLTNKRRGFTLVEMLVVVGMIAVILGALSMSVSSAQERARRQKALAEVKVINQTILASENFKKNSELTDTGSWKELTIDEFPDLFGKGKDERGTGNIPVLFLAAANSSGKVLDPWGKVYRVRIKRGSATSTIKSATGGLQTSFVVPNMYRLSEEERK